MTTKSSMKRYMSTIDSEILAKAWSGQLLALENEKPSMDRFVRATHRSLPLLQDASSVPFVCRYRTDIIDPLTTRQVHFLQSLVAKHADLEPLRQKLLLVIPTNEDPALVERIQTSTSKSELEDLYAPFKPPSKGSILERIQKEHPQLVEQVDKLWSGDSSIQLSKLQPRDALLHLLSTKIAAEPKIMDVVLTEMQRHCRVKTSVIQDDANKYRNYADFAAPLIHLRDHQVLAIRRGVDQKAIKMSYDIDGAKMEACIKYHLFKIIPSELKTRLLDEAVHDAWTRLLRRRGTSRLWTEKCKAAQERACQVFAQNLHRALLAPPFTPPTHVLALDPGFQAGIKCVVLDADGKVIKLETIQHLGNHRERGVQLLSELLTFVQGLGTEKVVVALGNGHGSQEARALIEQASKTSQIPIDIQLVSEAGASVWSVTEAAKMEFPDEPPAAIASISIGRRLQNPLHELVKVPPRSLGLGMYQHDLSEKELDEKLHLTSVDAVATVGVDANSCSLEILQKVPGLTKLAAKIVKARPLRERKDLLSVSGLGPKTFENCAAFCRVKGTEPLDETLVHPESYDLARWLLKKMSWKLSETPRDIPPKRAWTAKWDAVIKKASEEFGLNSARVLAILENLIDSMMNVDPRLKEEEEKNGSNAGSIKECVLLSPELTDMAALQAACPLRGIVGTIRNIADFGAFIDFGGHNDGLLHTSKLGPVQLHSLLIGQQVGVDILSADKGRVSLGLAGLGLQPDKPRTAASVSSGQYRSISTSSRPHWQGDKRAGKKRGSSSNAFRSTKKKK